MAAWLQSRSLPGAILFALLMVGLWETAATAEPASQTGTPHFAPSSRVVYKKMGDVELHLDVFTPAGDSATGRKPAIVFFFGGGWNAGTPAQFYPHCAFFAERGFLACSAEYRVKSRNGTTPLECVTDGKSAVRYLRLHAGELGIDPKRIVAAGGSAGGHVAACTALIPTLDDPAEDSSVSSRPNALVLFNPVVDTTPKGYGAERLTSRALEISPVHHVAKGAPPVIIFHGTSDRTVPFENVERFTTRMREAGNVCELVSCAGQGHGFFNHPSFRPGTDPKWFDETAGKALQFLQEQGIIGSPSGGAGEKAASPSPSSSSNARK